MEAQSGKAATLTCTVTEHTASPSTVVWKLGPDTLAEGAQYAVSQYRVKTQREEERNSLFISLL